MKMMEKLLTIIIPVYKVEKYIRQCLDSVICPPPQMEQLEVIVVNDGTPDNSALIAHEYADKYPNTIKVIDKENGGHGSAWNVGLSLATGKYIRFLDSDDWLSNLSDFMNILDSLDVDLVFTHLSKYYENSKKSVIEKVKGVKFESLYNTSTFSCLHTGNEYGIYNFWYCTYKTEMLQKEYPLFIERVFYDDSILYLIPYISGNAMVFLDMPLYNYRLGRIGQSVDENVMRGHLNDFIKVCEGMIRYINNHKSINLNQKEQRDDMMSAWIKCRIAEVSFLPYKEYKKYMFEWYSIVKRLPFVKKSPKMYIYQYSSSFISWSCIQLFNKYVLLIINR